MDEKQLDFKIVQQLPFGTTTSPRSEVPWIQGMNELCLVICHTGSFRVVETSALIDGDVVMYDSRVIAFYLVRLVMMSLNAMFLERKTWRLEFTFCAIDKVRIRL